MGKIDAGILARRQSLPLEQKIILSKTRIREFLLYEGIKYG